VKFNKNYGFAEGNNRGAKKTKGDYVIFLNNDTSVEPEWLMELVKAARPDDVGICGSKIFDKKIGEIGEGHMFMGIEYQKSGNKMKECFWVSGCSMLVKKKTIKEMGDFFDSSYFMYYEDMDACWRARNLGYKVVYTPNSVVYHKGSTPNEKTKYLHYRNKIRTFKKNSSFPLAQIYLAAIAGIVVLKCPRGHKKEMIREILRSN
jgi:GT2 family glycosyltransferase